MSVFFIKIGLVAVGAKQDVRHPVRRSAHLLTDHIQVNIKAAFDDQLIMNVTDDEAVSESFHGVTEDVAADGLDDVLHELRAIGFDAFGYSDAVKPPVRSTGNRQSGQKETASLNIWCGKAATLENSNSSRVVPS